MVHKKKTDFEFFAFVMSQKCIHAYAPIQSTSV